MKASGKAGGLYLLVVVVPVLVSVLALGLSFLLYCTDFGSFMVAGRSSLVIVARPDASSVIATALVLFISSLILLRAPRNWIAWVAWVSLWVWWCALGMTMTVYPDSGTVRSLWFFVKTNTVFDAAEEDWTRSDGTRMEDVEEITGRTTVASASWSLTFSYNGRSSSVFVGPVVSTKALDVLAYSGFRVVGYQAPTCHNGKSTAEVCVGKEIPQHIPFMR